MLRKAPWLLLPCFSLGLTLSAEGPLSSVRFRVVDVFGRDLPYRVAAFVNSESGLDLFGRFDHLIARGIPAGTYKYKVVRQDYLADVGWEVGQIDVDREDVVIILLGEEIRASVGGTPASISTGPLPAFSIDGQIDPTPQAGNVISIRLKGLYQPYEVDIAVGPDGKFKILKPLHGLFILTVIRNGEVAGIEAVVFRQGAEHGRLNVDMKSISALTEYVNPIGPKQ